MLFGEKDRREAAQAGFFYPGKREACLKALAECLPDAVESPENLIGAVVPHAGWTFSGPTAGKVYRAVAQSRKPRTFLVLGAVHTFGVSRSAIWRKGAWDTPLGSIAIDEGLADKILERCGDWVLDKKSPHVSEHSIEVQVPFIQHLFPEAMLVPILVSPFEEAHILGAALADAVDEDVMVLASTDLTHYGPRFDFAPMGTGSKAIEWVRDENDRRILELMVRGEAEKIVPEAMSHHNACGAGAIAALLGYVRSRGRTEGVLLHYTTSWDVLPDRDTGTFVSYAGVVF